MTLLAIGIVISAVFAFALLYLTSQYFDGWLEWVCAATGGILTVAAMVGLICWLVLAYNYTASRYKAEVLNREYKTEYTRLEVFYASDVIDTIRQLDRKRIEINGDLLKDKK